MICPLCKTEMRIQGSHYKLSNDDTPDKATALSIVHEFECRNKNCSNFGKVCGIQENPINLNAGIK